MNTDARIAVEDLPSVIDQADEQIAYCNRTARAHYYLDRTLRRLTAAVETDNDRRIRFEIWQMSRSFDAKLAILDEFNQLRDRKRRLTLPQLTTTASHINFFRTPNDAIKGKRVIKDSGKIRNTYCAHLIDRVIHKWLEKVIRIITAPLLDERQMIFRGGGFAIPTPGNRQAGHGAGASQVTEPPEELLAYVLHMTAATILWRDRGNFKA